MKTTKTKAALLALLASLFASAAWAGAGHMPATHLGAAFMSLLDVDTMRSDDGVHYTAWSSVYLAQSDPQLAQDGNVDFMAVLAQYDCRTPGRWRMESTHLYGLEQPSRPLASNTGALNAWTVAPPHTPPFATWQGVCEQRFDESSVEFNVMQKRSDILKRYRQMLRSAN